MTSHHRRRRTRTALLLDVVVVGLGLAGFAALASARLVERGSPPVRLSGELWSPPVPALSSSALPSEALPSPALQSTIPRATPLRLWIPTIGVDTPLIRLGLNPDRTLQVPTDFSVAGWYDLGPSPGQPGPAVIVGHVDSKKGPAVFFRLGSVRPGSLVRVELAGSTDALFRVYAVREFAKAAFPTALVYGPTPGPELRLVTCGGPFDSRTGHYLDNVVVFARFAGE